MKSERNTKAEPQAGRRRLDRVVLHPFQLDIIAALLSGKRVTICSGRNYGVRYAEQIAKEIKYRMDEMQNTSLQGTGHLVARTLQGVVQFENKTPKENA